MKEIIASDLGDAIPSDAGFAKVMLGKPSVNKLYKIENGEWFVYNRAEEIWMKCAIGPESHKLIKIVFKGAKKQKPKYKMSLGIGKGSDCRKCCFGSLAVDCLSMKRPECEGSQRKDGKNYYFELIDVRTN